MNWDELGRNRWLLNPSIRLEGLRKQKSGQSVSAKIRIDHLSNRTLQRYSSTNLTGFALAFTHLQAKCGFRRSTIHAEIRTVIVTGNGHLVDLDVDEKIILIYIYI
jgi:hypothetical protein